MMMLTMLAFLQPSVSLNDDDDDIEDSFPTPVSVQDGFHSWRVQSSAASHSLKY